MEELTARMASLIRRYTRFNQPQDPPGRLVYAGLEIDPEGAAITTAGGTFELPRREFECAECCWARHQGRILTKQQIYESVWQEPYCYDDSNIMPSSAACAKAGKRPGTPQYIQTIKGIGYRFNREV